MRLTVSLVALALFAATPLAAQTPPDLVVVNAVVHTADPAQPRAEALAVTDGRITAVGTTAEIVALAGLATERIDAHGRTVIPGLIDAHAHVMGLGRALRILDLVGTTSAEEVAERVRQAAAERPAGEWIVGRGWDQNDWAVQEFPDHALLDAAAPGRAVYLSRVDGHAAWVSAAALAAAGVTAATPDPDGGRIERGPDGAPTGVFVDNAQALVARAIPGSSEAEREAQLEAALARMAAVGLTGVHDMGVDPSALALYRRWAADGRLTARIVGYLGSDRETLDWWSAAGSAEVLPDSGGRLRVLGVKFYADGALGSRGAALLADYSDDPGNVGLLVTPAEELASEVARVRAAGLQPAIHAIGDRGNRVALDAIAGAPASDGALPPRIEHSQVVALDDVPRFAALGVVASFQPTHGTSDMPWAEERVGPDRIAGAYAWRTFRDAGVAIACGSDFPVENANPFHGLYAAITRQDLEGNPPGGWRAHEAMTREEALACFTIDAARAAGMDGEVGSLAPGKRADFLILDRDPMTVDAREIADARVMRTVVGGETVHEPAPEIDVPEGAT